MPRMQRRPGRTRRHWEVLNFVQVMRGHSIVSEASLTADELQQCWQEWREELLALHSGLHPGSRPFCWWWLEAPEPRRRLDRPVQPGGGTPGRRRLYYGVPAVLVTEDDCAAVYESQLAYLQRLTLLTGDEQQRVRAGAVLQWEGPGEPYVSLARLRQWREAHHP